MTVMIVLDAVQAADVAGPTAPGHALDPRRLADGETWVLPTSVLEDPAHYAMHQALSALPQRQVSAGEFPAPEPIDD